MIIFAHVVVSTEDSIASIFSCNHDVIYWNTVLIPSLCFEITYYLIDEYSKFY